MQDALVALAEHDTAMVRARHAVGHPPSLPAHEAAMGELRALRARKLELDAEREPLAERASALEAEATAARAREAAIATRLDTATGAARELEAMAHERDGQAQRAARLEDELLEVLEALEPLEARDATLRAEAADAAARRDALALQVGEQRAAATAAVEEGESTRRALVAAVEPSLLARYEAIAARAGGVGAARLVDGRCGACRVSVPAAVADHLLHGADPDAVEVCDECGRLLVA